MIIKVTQADIQNAKLGTCDRCPVALAIARELKVERVGVYPHGAWWQGDKFAKFPPEATEFVKKFDNEEYVYPFSFEIEESPC